MVNRDLAEEPRRAKRQRSRLKLAVALPVFLFMATPAVGFQPLRPHTLRWNPVSFSELRSSRLSMSVPLFGPQLSVALDRPLLSKDTTFGQKSLFGAAKSVWKGAMAASLADVLRVTALSLAFAMVFSVLVCNSSVFGTLFKIVRGRFQRLIDRMKAKDSQGTPMPFPTGSNDGWGVCTLKSKQRLGNTSFFNYEFELPKEDYRLPLNLGQQLSMCVLDSRGKVAQGQFFPWKMSLGSFSVLTPSRDTDVGGDDTSNFVRVLNEEIRVGDEIALKPGVNKLEYRGQYLPVTDMVYVAVGLGIVPVVEQIRAVLPKGSSSVKTVTVVWINESTRDFDVISDELEGEYYKYRSKLAVTCVVDDIKARSKLAENMEIVEAVPNYVRGTMAVLSGPRMHMKKLASYLVDRGYPMDCMCVM